MSGLLIQLLAAENCQIFNKKNFVDHPVATSCGTNIFDQSISLNTCGCSNIIYIWLLSSLVRCNFVYRALSASFVEVHVAHFLVADAMVGEGTYFAGLIALLKILATKYLLL